MTSQAATSPLQALRRHSWRWAALLLWLILAVGDVAVTFGAQAGPLTDAEIRASLCHAGDDGGAPVGGVPDGGACRLCCLAALGTALPPPVATAGAPPPPLAGLFPLSPFSPAVVPDPGHGLAAPRAPPIPA